MSKQNIILLGAAILILVLLVLGLFFFLKPKPVAQNNPGTTTLPSSGVTPAGSGTIAVAGTGGSTVQTADFLHNGVTYEDPANAGQYYLAGTSGVCDAQGNCPKAGTATNYNIVYFSSSKTFVIGLADEPLGAIRLEAEQNLMHILGLSSDQMCKLDYTVITSSYVSPTYGGKNLGFSFCPGAVPLP